MYLIQPNGTQFGVMNFEDLKIGDFFKLDPSSPITYQKRWEEVNTGPCSRIEKAWNTRTGEFEYVFGPVHPTFPMSQEAIEKEQADHQMWGEVAKIHDTQLRADIN